MEDKLFYGFFSLRMHRDDQERTISIEALIKHISFILKKYGLFLK
jgi:hypothetical protein